MLKDESLKDVLLESLAGVDASVRRESLHGIANSSCLLSRHTPRQQLQQVSGFDDDKRIKSLAGGLDSHGSLNLH